MPTPLSSCGFNDATALISGDSENPTALWVKLSFFRISYEEIHGRPGGPTRSMGCHMVFTGTVSRDPWETRWWIYRDCLKRSMGYQVMVFTGTVSRDPWETRRSLQGQSRENHGRPGGLYRDSHTRSMRCQVVVFTGTVS